MKPIKQMSESDVAALRMHDFLCGDDPTFTRLLPELVGDEEYKSYEFPNVKSWCIVTNNGGVAPLYWTQATSPSRGMTRQGYFEQLVFKHKFGIREAREIADDFCKYHNKMGEASGQDYVHMVWETLTKPQPGSN